MWLIDAAGRSFLDAYNNVRQVGHCHPTFAQALAQQAATLNTNTRYLFESAIEYFKVCVSSDPDISTRERAKSYMAGSLGKLARQDLGKKKFASALEYIDEAVGMQLTKSARENLGRDSGSNAQILKPLGPHQQLPYQHQAPTIADHIERPADRVKDLGRPQALGLSA